MKLTESELLAIGFQQNGKRFQLSGDPPLHVVIYSDGTTEVYVESADGCSIEFRHVKDIRKLRLLVEGMQREPDRSGEEGQSAMLELREKYGHHFDTMEGNMTTEQLLETITGAKKRTDVVPAYRKGIIENRAAIDWPKVNFAIMERWSRSALIFIKTQAWKQ